MIYSVGVNEGSYNSSVVVVYDISIDYSYPTINSVGVVKAYDELWIEDDSILEYTQDKAINCIVQYLVDVVKGNIKFKNSESRVMFKKKSKLQFIIDLNHVITSS